MIARVLSDSAREGPALVYVPGIDGTGELLLGTAARLERSFRLLRLEYRHEPGVRVSGDGFAELAASVAACLRTREVGRVLLLAESFGVALALRTALDHPQLVSGIALVNGFAHYPVRWRIRLSSVLASLVPHPVFRLGRSLFAQHSLFAPRQDARALREFRALPGASFDSGYLQRLRMVRRVDLRPQLADIHQPVAVYASDRDRIVPAVAAAEVLAAGLPDATLHVLPQAGHVVLPLAEEPWSERMKDLARRSERAGVPTPGTSRAS